MGHHAVTVTPVVCTFPELLRLRVWAAAAPCSSVCVHTLIGGA
jgi:hypothetical protein